MNSQGLGSFGTEKPLEPKKPKLNETQRFPEGFCDFLKENVKILGKNQNRVTHIQNDVYSISIYTYIHIYSLFARRTIYTFHSTRALPIRLHLESTDTLNRNKCVYSATGDR